METVDILKDYLISRSYLDEVISYNQFAKLLKGQNEALIKELYEELKIARERSIQKVDESIKDGFDIPVDQIEVNLTEDSPASKISLSKLLQKLNVLKGTIEAECTILDRDIQSLLNVINNHIEGLQGLFENTHWANNEEESTLPHIAIEAMKTVKTAEKLLSKRE